MYVLVNPFSQGTSRGAVSGIDRYINLSLPLLSPLVPVTQLRRPLGVSKSEFRELVREELSRLRREHPWVMVESPEAAAATLHCADLDVPIHVRCHCPSGLAQHFDGREVDRIGLEEEIRALRSASFISAPARSIAEMVQPVVPSRGLHLYPHPPPARTAATEKKLDAIFLARAQHLKGADFLAEVLRALPARTHVLVAGFGCEHLRLPRGIKCHVERSGELAPEEARSRLSSAKVLLHLSRFEAFGMTLAEAIAAQTSSVSWPTGIAPELVEFGVCAVAPAHDIASFCRAALAYIEAPPSPESFMRAHAHLLGEFEAGAGQILRRRTSHLVSFQSNPLLLNLLQNKMPPEKRKPSDSWSRKWRKLQRDPAGFFRDSKVRTIGEQLLGGRGALSKTPTAPLEPKKQRDRDATPSVSHARVLAASQEPRVLTDIYLTTSGTLHVESWEKKIAESCLSSAIFCPRDDRRLIDHDLLREACSDKNFVGFRDRYLFAARHDLGRDYRSVNDLEQLFLANEGGWKKAPLAGIRNAIFLNPENILPLLIRAIHPEIRVIVFQDRAPARFLEDWGGPDVLVTTQGVDMHASAARRLIVDSSAAFVQTLRELIVDHKIKEKNMFLPVYGNARPLDDMGALLDSKNDGVIALKSNYKPNHLDQTFEALVARMCEHVDYVLLREETFLRFQDLCAEGDLRSLLLETLKSGCRYEVRS